MNRAMAVRKTTPTTPIVTPIPMAAGVERPCRGCVAADADADDESVGVVVGVEAGRVDVDVVVKSWTITGPLVRVGAAAKVDVVVVRSGDGVATVENRESLTSPTRTKERAWPGCGCVVFVDIPSIVFVKSRCRTVLLAVLLK